MEVHFEGADLARLETDKSFTAGLPPEAVKGFRKAMQAIRAASDERDLYNGGRRPEKLQGPRQGQHSLRLNKQWRLIFRLEPNPSGKGNRAALMEIEDYH